MLNKRWVTLPIEADGYHKAKGINSCQLFVGEQP